MQALCPGTSAAPGHAPPADAVPLRYRIDGHGPVRVADGSDGAEQMPGLRPLPADADLTGTRSSGLSTIAAEVTVD